MHYWPRGVSLFLHQNPRRGNDTPELRLATSPVAGIIVTGTPYRAVIGPTLHTAGVVLDDAHSGFYQVDLRGYMNHDTAGKMPDKLGPGNHSGFLIQPFLKSWLGN